MSTTIPFYPWRNDLPAERLFYPPPASPANFPSKIILAPIRRVVLKEEYPSLSPKNCLDGWGFIHSLRWSRMASSRTSHKRWDDIYDKLFFCHIYYYRKLNAVIIYNGARLIEKWRDGKFVLQIQKRFTLYLLILFPTRSVRHFIRHRNAAAAATAATAIPTDARLSRDQLCCARCAYLWWLSWWVNAVCR